jgi:hypothetical protein
VAVVRTDVSQENISSVFRVKIISELGTMLAVTSTLIIFILKMEAILSFETSVLPRATHHIPEDGFHHLVSFG